MNRSDSRLRASLAFRRPLSTLTRTTLTRAMAACMLAAGVVSCDAPSSTRPDFAYDPTTLSRGQLYRWASGRQISVWAEVGTGLSTVDLGAAVRQAITTWNAVPQFAEFKLSMASSIKDADIVVYDRATAVPVSAGSCAFDPQGSAGYTYFCPAGASPTTAQKLALIAGGASHISVLIRVDRGRVTDQSGYVALVTHEFGHAVGIGGHSDTPSDVMFGLPTVATPTTRDRSTLQSLLGKRPDITL